MKKAEKSKFIQDILSDGGSSPANVSFKDALKKVKGADPRNIRTKELTVAELHLLQLWELKQEEKARGGGSRFGRR